MRVSERVRARWDPVRRAGSRGVAEVVVVGEGLLDVWR